MPISDVTSLRPTGEGHLVVTGGAGFLGANLAARLLAAGEAVVIIDDLSRPGVEDNVRWLRRRNPGLRVEIGDVRDRALMRRVLTGARGVFHLAAQVAVESSVVAPWHDFEVNALGTLSVLEAARAQAEPPFVVYSSTSRVYGALDDVPLAIQGKRYVPGPLALRGGIDETRALDFSTPHGCSKGAGDQYVREYARTFGLRTVVLRLGSVYGPRQLGTEIQGFVARFLARALAREPVVMFGEGVQVRDVLFVDDAVEALLHAGVNARALAGKAFNVGGGPRQALSLLELVALLRERYGLAVRLEQRAPRSGDPRYCVSNSAAFEGATGWRPRVSVLHGLDQLHAWLLGSDDVWDRPAPVDRAVS